MNTSDGADYVVFTSGPGLVNEELLAVSSRIVSALEVAYVGDTVRISCAGSDPSLKIAAFGASKAVINGGAPTPIRTKNGFFRPFAGKS